MSDTPSEAIQSRFTESEDGAFRSIRGVDGKPVVSNLSVSEKRDLALSLGVPAPDSGLPGAWQDSDAKRVLAVPFTDETVDRHGTAFLSDGWDFDNYLRNPVVLFNHTSEVPIGTTLKISPSRMTGKGGTTRKGYTAHILFSRDELNPEAEVVYRNWLAGRIRGASVGFRPLDWREPTDKERNRLGLEGDDENALIISRAELLEISAVTVPSNSSAVKREVETMTRAALNHGMFSKDDLKLLYGEGTVWNIEEELPESRTTLDEDETIRLCEEVADEARHIIAVEDTEDTSMAIFVKEAEEALEAEEASAPVSRTASGPVSVSDAVSDALSVVEKVENDSMEIIEVNGKRYVAADDLETWESRKSDLNAAAELIAASAEGQPLDLKRSIGELRKDLDHLRSEIREIGEGLATLETSGAEPSPTEDSVSRGLYNNLLNLETSFSRVGKTQGDSNV